jgi:hypothetical protein
MNIHQRDEHGQVPNKLKKRFSFPCIIDSTALSSSIWLITAAVCVRDWQPSYRVASEKKKPHPTQHPSRMMLVHEELEKNTASIMDECQQTKRETLKNRVELSICHKPCKWTKRDWLSQVSENHIILKTHVWKPSHLQSPKAWMLQQEFDGWIQLSSIS